MGREQVFCYGDIGSRFFCGFVAPAGGGLFPRQPIYLLPIAYTKTEDGVYEI